MIRQFIAELDDKRKTLIFILGISAITFFICLNIVRAGTRKADDIRRSINEESKRHALRSEIEGIKKNQQKYLMYFYDDMDQPSLRAIVTNAAKATGVGITAMKPIARETIGGVVKESLDVSIESTYKQFGAFAAQIENIERITKVESVSIKQRLAFSVQGRGEEQTEIKDEDPVLSIAVIISAYAVKG